ncbi:PREDICTED: Wilms tumor protein 1-interacting protein-like [Pseudopodoces humilis]|uniref:Wilms tumor protein 1-interacting protein-like n=1 Tax=Pseudopodoces humilis TaxID=181119 RepID=UPI0006B777B9|nr:PREDICTED: Wilms tumor protein 1-interacting protein-like [Pseudopodoces humilis]
MLRNKAPEEAAGKGRPRCSPTAELPLGTEQRAGGRKRLFLPGGGAGGGARWWGRPSPRCQWIRSCGSARAGAPESDPTSGSSLRPRNFAHGVKRPEEEWGVGGGRRRTPGCRGSVRRAVPAAAQRDRSGAGGAVWHPPNPSQRNRARGYSFAAGMSDSSEGIVSLPVPGPPGGGTPCEEVLGRRAPGADTGARSLPPDLAAPPPAALWAEDAAAASCPSTAARAKGGGRRTAVTYVINEASQGPLLAAESGALQSLREACEAVGAALETLHFGKLDFGETAVLDRFYNAGEKGCPAGADHHSAGPARPGLAVTAPGSPRGGGSSSGRRLLRAPSPGVPGCSDSRRGGSVGR